MRWSEYSELRNETRADFADDWPVTCQDCGETFGSQETCEFEGKVWCHDCLEADGGARCDACGEWGRDLYPHEYLYHDQPCIDHYCVTCVTEVVL